MGMTSAYQSSSRKSQHRHVEVGVGAKPAAIEPRLTYNESRSIRSSPKVIQMTDHPLREPNQIRAECVRKLKPIETGIMFTAVLAALVDEEWTTPKIEELVITSDRCILARPTGEMTHRIFLGAEADLIRSIHGVAEVAGLDGDELGYLLGTVAEARRIE
jgi:hypothetical protein